LHPFALELSEEFGQILSYVTLSWHYLALRSMLDELARLSLELEIDGISIVELGVRVSMLIHTNVVISCAC